MNIKLNAFRCFHKMFPPLPKGEGRGEGEGAVRQPVPAVATRRARRALGFSLGLAASLFAVSSFGAAHGGAPGGGAPRGGGAPGGGMAPRPALSPSRPALTPPGPAIVERPTHGTIRHLDSHAFQRPVEVRPEPQRRIEPGREFGTRHDAFVHHDLDVDVRRHHGADDFHFHRHFRELPFGFLTLAVAGVPFYYYDGIYYQTADGGYDEVYPPDGATIPQPPDGAIPIYAGGVTYYYAGGAFYVQQPDGSYAIVAAPIGVVVPELPPGAVQVNINGNTAYQFDTVYYEPVFLNGVTQYQTVGPSR